jgi:SPOR domain
LIWLLRYISVRLWLTVLFSLPSSIYLVHRFNTVLSDTNPAVLFLCIALFFFIILGFALDLTGKKLIAKLIKEGAAWERAEIYKRSEERYYKALRIYDSFLISPFSAKGSAEKISEAIAKFTAVSEISDATFKKTSTLFLKLSPNDEHMALLWLKRLFRTKNLALNTIDHDTLTLIAENHYNNPKILPLLTNIFVQLNRADFTAQKVYKKALTHLKKDSKKRIVIQNLVREIKEEGEIPSELSFAEPPPRKKYASNLIKKAGSAILGFLNFIPSISRKLFYLLTTDKKTKKILKYSFILLTFCLAVFLMFTTLSTLFKPKPKKIEVKQKIVAVPVPQMPYTIQTAAFLSRPHAENYTKKLKKSGLDARFVKIEGKNKTWFLVRISKFPDKSSAAAYGQKLKREGLIKDFFVANK